MAILTGKTALVTGASRGRARALALAAAGALFAEERHLTHTVTTGVFAIYPLVVAAVLVGFGDLSDYIGGRAAILRGVGRGRKTPWPKGRPKQPPENAGVLNMAKTTEESNKALVLEAFDTLFNKRDYKAAERYWSFNYIQHSAHIAPGRDGLFNLVRSTPPALKYEPGVAVAEKDYVIVHGRFSGSPPILSEWPTAYSRNTGMFCRMRRPKRSREAVCRCSGRRFPSERGQSLNNWFSPLNPKKQPKPNSWQGGMPAVGLLAFPRLSASRYLTDQRGRSGDVC